MSSEQQFKAWAAFEPKGQLSEWSYTPRPLGPHDIEIDITHCGMCATDLHRIDSGWGPSKYPLVPGHEIVGLVTHLGSEVTRFKVGQRVGVGAQCQSCHQCDDCNERLQAYCDKKVMTYGSTFSDGASSYGGYAKNIRVDERFSFAIPENIKSEEAAPLLCAGITLYDPLKHFGAGPGKKVGIVGIGGLGHLGLKFARALGAEVYAISTSASKEEEAKKLGAHHFINTKDKASLEKNQDQLDLIVSTLNQDVDWQMYFSLVKRDGTFVIVGIPEEKLQIPAFSIIGKRLKFAGSAIGSPNEIEEMLKLASKDNIVANTQVWPLEKVNEAIAAFREGKPRYRYVLQIKQ
eukprot:TRINITY_DN626_c0_g1_i1.p1 TRINITY_DN626_c0_g1~~TRINITY_DN626_c0_g1_i1.p1  ORF type:complete len:348 (-),score=75.36 TRINITY_DN626_c0_g1_i1:42-1085(-)